MPVYVHVVSLIAFSGQGPNPLHRIHLQALCFCFLKITSLLYIIKQTGLFLQYLFSLFMILFLLRGCHGRRIRMDIHHLSVLFLCVSDDLHLTARMFGFVFAHCHKIGRMIYHIAISVNIAFPAVLLPHKKGIFAVFYQETQAFLASQIPILLIIGKRQRKYQLYVFIPNLLLQTQNNLSRPYIHSKRASYIKALDGCFIMELFKFVFQRPLDFFA